MSTLNLLACRDCCGYTVIGTYVGDELPGMWVDPKTLGEVEGFLKKHRGHALIFDTEHAIDAIPGMEPDELKAT